MFFYGKARPKALLLPFRAFSDGKKDYLKNKCSQYVPRRFGIDAHHLITKIKTGKEEFGYSILREQAKSEEPNLFFVYAKKQPDFSLPYKFNWRQISWPSIFWYLSVLYQMKRDGVEVLFCPTSYILPALKPKISLPIVHDLAVLRSDFKSKPRAKLVETRLLKRINKCPKIIAISEFTKKDLLEHFPEINADKVEIVYPGVRFKDIISEARAKIILNKLEIKKPYILGVGTIEPRKNFQGLIDAYLSLPEILRNKYQLIFAGKPGWFSEEIYVKAKGHENQIKFLGYMEEKQLTAVFGQANMFALPSFWEGFGMPVLEAFHFNVPVICSQISSLPEVAGKAAILVNPNEIDTITKAIIELDQPEVSKRLVELGKERLSHFSYKKSAQKLNRILEDYSPS
jgi:glycosyltransferase involved in cell wall biosynthesis